MKLKRSMKPLQLLPILFIVFFTPANAQNLNFKSYGADKGLRDNYVYTVQQDNNGFLWLGTGEGLCRFDGFNFSEEFRGDTLSSVIVDKSFRDSKGRLWFGFRDGSIAVYLDRKFRVIRPDSSYTGIIAGFAENSKGQVIIATQNKGIILVKDDYTLSYFNGGFEGQYLSSICITDEDELLVGTFDGLHIYRINMDQSAVERLGRVKDIPYSKILTIVHQPGSQEYWIGLEDDGLYLLSKLGNEIGAARISKIGVEFGLAYSKVQKVLEDDEGYLWVCTNGDGVFRLTPSASGILFSAVTRFTKDSGMPSDFFSDIFMDYEGNLWFASTGQGITVLKNQAFSFCNFERPGFNDNILSIANIESIYYLGGEKGILVTDLKGSQQEYLLGSANGLPDDKINSLFRDSKNEIWIGTSRSGLFRLKPGERQVRKVFSSANSLENSINAVRESRDYIWIATNGGVIRLGKSEMGIKRFTTDDRLPHNKIRDLIVDSRDQVWIATRANGLFNISELSEYNIDVRTELEFVSLTEDRDGKLWAATEGDGVFLFARDSLVHFTISQGLRSNYCYSISTDKLGNIWVGHRLGMSRIDKSTQTIATFSVEQGISVDCNFNAVITSSDENLVFGTSKGIIIYDPTKDKKDLQPPGLNITSVRISDQEYDFTGDIVLPYNTYKLRIEFIGINLKNPEGVRYQYKLLGYDDAWTEPSPVSTANFRLQDGEYAFILKACDETGLCSESRLLNITVRIPVWKRWWFIMLFMIAIVAVVYIIIRVRERNQKLIQEYLQKELDARTKEVREQAQEIENKNRDITDSINYAQRIQASVLPPIKRLQDTFPGSFIFYQPRDIVSGDFYWYDSLWDHKFVIVCADSTGHGVPGAFMSMIGTTLIKDICSRPDVRSPAQVLKTLDQEIMNALNQNAEIERSNDGMDIIVAEFDLKTKYLRVASAMRPLIIYSKDEQVYVKGTRNSVGGRFDQDSESKSYEEEGYQLSSGDLIYMFSDGYPDQFGGPLGKKFKMVRLKNLLRDIHDKPMEEQYHYVKNNFNLWKEDLEQVDDVLFMGIKV